ncbi:Dihydropteroate synthase DHPS [Planctomycetales bacterium 10988]|nr:Dihydropteroate synthase DHPS [Planctomycetales bacterium 10988]
MSRPHWHFVTGKLAADSLANLLKELAPQANFDYSLQVLPVKVAALMTADWVAPRLELSANVTHLMLPGRCRGSLSTLEEQLKIPVVRGPGDYRDLPEYFGKKSERLKHYGPYDIEILAEINHAASWTIPEILKQAKRWRAEGANLIDVGCDPGVTWAGVGEVVQALRDDGHRVSVDSLNPQEIELATQAGAELVLSVNSSNREFAQDWEVEVVAIPDSPEDWKSLEETVDYLETKKILHRIDPILEPIGFGFAESLIRYQKARKQWPETDIMMGIGNLSELSEVDSSGVNFLLLGICQEWQIDSILTTEVINWARSSVKECDIARRMVYYAIHHQNLPKHLTAELLLLRDAKQRELSTEEINKLAEQITDKNFRLFLSQGLLYVINSEMNLSHEDPFELFEQVLKKTKVTIDAGHAFYLGYEMAKAVTARTLGKSYSQDQALTWGFLTEEEQSFLEKKRQEKIEQRAIKKQKKRPL